MFLLYKIKIRENYIDLTDNFFIFIFLGNFIIICILSAAVAGFA